MIDKYSGDINAFKNIEEFKNDIKVHKKLQNLLQEYIKNEDVTRNDEIKCSEERIRLVEIF